MNLIDVIKYSWSSIKTQKSRTALTVLGVLIGIAAIVALLSLSNGFQVAITAQFEKGFSTKVIQVTTGGGFGSSSSADFSLVTEDADTIESIQHVQMAIPVIQKAVSVVINGSAKNFAVYGVDFEKYGELFSSFVAEKGIIPLDTGNGQFVIGHNLYVSSSNTTIYYNVGDAMTIKWVVKQGTMSTPTEYDSYTNTIAAVLPEIGGFSMGGGPNDNGIYIQIKLAKSSFDTDKVSTILVLLDSDSKDVINAVSADIKKTFDNKVSVISSTQLLSTISSVFSIISIFLGGIAGIALIVAGIGIMNIMIVSIMERTREIGILKSLGLKNRSILSIFLIESAIIGLIGSISGIVVGWLIANLFSLMFSGGGFTAIGGGGGGGGGFGGGLSMSIVPVLDLPLLLEALVFGVGIAVVFGLYPAWRASRLEPVKALRYE